MQHLASLVGIRNLPEEAHHWGGVVGAGGNCLQCLCRLRDGPEQQVRDVKMRMAPTPSGKRLAWRDPILAPWLLRYEVLSDVEVDWPNEVEKGSVGSGRRGEC